MSKIPERIIRDIKLPENISNANNPPSRGSGPQADKGQEKKISLDSIINGISIAIINAKSVADQHISEIKTSYEKNELLRSLPLNILNIDEVEVDLRFAITDVEKGEQGTKIFIDTDVHKLASLQAESISRIKFKIVSKPIMEYKVDDSKILL